MPLYPDHISAEERSARRAVNRHKWWQRRPNQFTRRPDYDGWLIARARPHARFYLSVAPQGNKGRLLHRPREQFIATRGSVRYTLTVALCGAETWWAVMRGEAAAVCPKCECVYAHADEAAPDQHVKVS